MIRPIKLPVDEQLAGDLQAELTRAERLGLRVTLHSLQDCILQYGARFCEEDHAKFGDLLMTDALPTEALPARLCLLAKHPALLGTIQSELLYQAVTQVGKCECLLDPEESRDWMNHVLAASFSQRTQLKASDLEDLTSMQKAMQCHHCDLAQLVALKQEMWKGSIFLRNFTTQKLGAAIMVWLNDRIKHLSKHAWHFSSMQKLQIDAASQSTIAALAGNNLEKVVAICSKIGKELDAILKGMDNVNDVKEGAEILRRTMKDRRRYYLYIHFPRSRLSLHISKICLSI